MNPLLVLALNIHIQGWCTGCQFHEFPYTTQIPLKINNVYPRLKFKSKKDVYEVSEKLLDELDSKKGNSHDRAYALSVQLPFFCCTYLFLKQEYQKDIEKYLYCKEFGIKPCPGSFGEQPKRWVKKSFVIKNAFSVAEIESSKKASRQAKTKGK